jgi:hypothetical protein
MFVEEIMIFRRYKCQNRNFGQAAALNFEVFLRYQKVMDCYDFWIYCEPLNEKISSQISYHLELN